MNLSLNNALFRFAKELISLIDKWSYEGAEMVLFLFRRHANVQNFIFAIYSVTLGNTYDYFIFLTINFNLYFYMDSNSEIGSQDFIIFLHHRLFSPVNYIVTKYNRPFENLKYPYIVSNQSALWDMHKFS